MSTDPERRSPSLESMSSASSAFSFDDNTGTTPNSPNLTAQSAPQGITDWMQGGQTNLLNELEVTKGTASLDDEHSKSFQAPHTPVETHPMHERFCFPAENIYFLVEGVLYSVHRYFFERDSSSFVGQGLSKQEPMVLANVSTHDFDLFLSILYPTCFGAYPASNVEEWSGILYLADKWSFQSIRTLAIAQIAPIASPIDKIVFGRLYDIDEWLTGAYQAVCTRLDALTLEEGRRIGVDDAIRINSIRQDFCFVRVSESSPTLREEDVESRFSLAVQTEHSATRKDMKNLVDRLKPDSAAEATSKKEEAARAAGIERKKRQQEAADKKAKDLKEKKMQKQREAEAKSEEEEMAKAAGIEQKKREQEAADKKAKELEEKKEAEAKSKEEEMAKAAEIERQKREREAADKRAKDLEDKKAPSAGAADSTPTKSSKKDTGIQKANPTAAISGISITSLGSAANEQEDWSQLDARDRYNRKKMKIGKESDAEELAELVMQMKQHAEGGAIQQGAGGTSDVSITEPNGMSGVSNISIGTPANKKDDGSHSTPEARRQEKLAKALSEYHDERRAAMSAAECAAKLAKLAQLQDKAKKQIADEAKAAEGVAVWGL